MHRAVTDPANNTLNFGPNWAVMLLPHIEQAPLFNLYATSINNYASNVNNAAASGPGSPPVAWMAASSAFCSASCS